MTTRTSKDIVADAWRAFASRDPARIAAGFTPDAQWIAPEGNATAVALNTTHHMIGRDAIAHFLAVAFPRLFAADVSVEFSSIHADGHTVIVEERMQATLANGRHDDNAYCFVFTLEGERIALVRECMDTKRGCSCLTSDTGALRNQSRLWCQPIAGVARLPRLRGGLSRKPMVSGRPLASGGAHGASTNRHRPRCGRRAHCPGVW